MGFNRCFRCMHELDQNTVCPKCGCDLNVKNESSLHLVPGTVLKGRYVVGKALGQGGFGITYIAWDDVFNRVVAVKEYLPLSIATRNTDSLSVTCASENLKEDYEYGLRKFLDEARILAMFTEMPNIVNVHDFFRANGTAYMVMEYIEGITFKEYLERSGGRIPWKQAEGVLSFVADALKEVHSRGLLHRDISPDNIYITESKQIKLLDFGAARIALGAQNKSFSIVLKHGYAPIEQYKSKGNQGPWTDIYALAATYYKSVTGRLPPESLERLEDDKLTPPSDFGIKIPPEKERALLKALSVNAEDRYQCVEEFINALRNKATRSSVHIQSDGEGGSGAGETSAGMRREEVPVKSAARRVVCPAKAKRVACYALALGAAAIIVIAITYQNSFARLNPVKSFSAPAISQPVNTSSSPVPGGVLNENSVARKAEPAKTADVVNQNSTPVKSVPAATIKKTESKEAREARLEIEKAKRELAEQKKRDADKEAIAREIKIHTGAQLGLQMLNNQ